MITHVVLFKLAKTDAASIAAAKTALARLQGQIPFLRHLEIGANIVHTERSYDLALVAKFDSLEDLQSYQNHPAHVEVLKYLQGIRLSTVVVDYETP